MATLRDTADRRAALAALLSAAVMIAQQVGSKATRDALFLSSFRAEDLPRVVIASAAASLVTVLLTSRAYARWGPAKVVPTAFGLSAAGYVAEWWFYESAPRPVAVVLYIHTAVFGALVISGFWSVVNERFDPHTAKTMVSRIGTGATFGGVAGGVLAERVGQWSSAEAMLLALAALNAVAGFGVSQIGGPRGARPVEPHEPTASAIQILRRLPYLRALAGLVALTAISAALLDYAFKAEAKLAFDDGSADMLRFFALFHVGAALVSFLLQTSIAKPALEKLGVAGSVATLPTVVLVAAAVSAGFTRLATVVVARAAELVLANSIFRSGYELLYTPVSPENKRPTKALIDVAGNRMGDALGSGLVLIVIAVAPTLATSIVLGLGALVAVGSLAVARWLHRGYVRQLEEMLRDRAPDAAEREVLRAATLQTLSTLGLDREALFEQLAAQQSWSDRQTYPSMGGETEEAAPAELHGIDAPASDPVHEAATTLRQGDPTQVRELLRSGHLDPRLARHLIALLARRDVYPDAVNALREIADDVVEPLIEALTDADQPFAIRRRLPRVLEVVTSEACAEGLARALADDKFEVRYRSALALSRVLSRAPGLGPTIETVHAAVHRELEASRRVWDSRRLLDDDAEDDAPLLDRALRDRVHRSVEHVFTLLSLVYETEPLRISLYALASDDPTLRGTALEYLENVLPEEIGAALFPMIDARVELRARRGRQEIVAELVQSMKSVDRGELVRAIQERESRRPKAPDDGSA